MKNVNWTLVMMFAMAGYFVYDKYSSKSEKSDDSEVVVHDPVVQKLGTAYKAKLVSVGGMPFSAVANGDFATLADLTKAQQKALDKGLEDAYIPIANALEAKFGKAEDAKNTASVASVQAFFKDLAVGYKK